MKSFREVGLLLFGFLLSPAQLCLRLFLSVSLGFGSGISGFLEPPWGAFGLGPGCRGLEWLEVKDSVGDALDEVESADVFKNGDGVCLDCLGLYIASICLEDMYNGWFEDSVDGT